MLRHFFGDLLRTGAEGLIRRLGAGINSLGDLFGFLGEILAHPGHGFLDRLVGGLVAVGEGTSDFERAVR